MNRAKEEDENSFETRPMIYVTLIWITFPVTVTVITEFYWQQISFVC